MQRPWLFVDWEEDAIITLKKVPTWKPPVSFLSLSVSRAPQRHRFLMQQPLSALYTVYGSAAAYLTATSTGQHEQLRVIVSHTVSFQLHITALIPLKFCFILMMTQSFIAGPPL